MNILLVGGTGVLSSAVTQEAIRKGIAVTMINRGNHPIPNGVELIKSDCTDFARIRKALDGRKFDAVMDFLLYSDSQTEESVKFYTPYTKQYFFISSCAVYNTDIMAGKPCNEEAVKSLPVWEYSVSKWKSEQKLQVFFKGLDCHYTVIRPCVTYGNTRIPYGISPEYRYHWTLVARIMADKPIIRWNGGTNRCNMTRVEDFAVGVVGLIGNEKAYNEAFNACGHEAPTWNDVLDSIAKAIGKKAKTVDITSEFYAKELPTRRGEILGGRSIDSVIDNSKLKAAVPEFDQTIFIDEGVKMTIDAYRNNNYEAGIDWTFDGDTDRIISKWCRQNGISTEGMNLHFIDYLDNATAGQRFQYFLERNKDNIFVRALKKGQYYTKRLTNKIKKLTR